VATVPASKAGFCKLGLRRPGYRRGSRGVGRGSSPLAIPLSLQPIDRPHRRPQGTGRQAVPAESGRCRREYQPGRSRPRQAGPGRSLGLSHIGELLDWAI